MEDLPAFIIRSIVVFGVAYAIIHCQVAKRRREGR